MYLGRRWINVMIITFLTDYGSINPNCQNMGPPSSKQKQLEISRLISYLIHFKQRELCTLNKQNFYFFNLRFSKFEIGSRLHRWADCRTMQISGWNRKGWGESKGVSSGCWGPAQPGLAHPQIQFHVYWQAHTLTACVKQCCNLTISSWCLY